MFHCAFSSATLQNTCLSPSSLIDGFHNICWFHTDDHNIMKKQVRKKKSTGSYLLFLLKFQPHRAPGNLLLFSTGWFFPVDVSYWAHRPSLTEHNTSFGDSLRVCIGTNSSWCESRISGATSVHHPRETILGEGILSVLWVRLFVTSTFWMHNSLQQMVILKKKDSLLNRIAKEREVHVLKL